MYKAGKPPQGAGKLRYGFTLDVRRVLSCVYLQSSD